MLQNYVTYLGQMVKSHLAICVVSFMVISPFIFIYKFKETYVDLFEVTIFKFTE